MRTISGRGLQHLRGGVHEKLNDLDGEQLPQGGKSHAHADDCDQRDAAQAENAGKQPRAVVAGGDGLDGLPHAGVDVLEHPGAGEHHPKDRQGHLAAVAHDLIVQNTGEDNKGKFQHRGTEPGCERFEHGPGEPERPHQLQLAPLLEQVAEHYHQLDNCAAHRGKGGRPPSPCP